jgi:hypothetical protein
LLADNHSQPLDYFHGLGVRGKINSNIFNFLLMSNLKIHPADYHYPLKKAQEDTKRWRKTQKVHAFAIDRQELIDIINEAPKEVDVVRVYFGMDEHGYEKMFLVAAKKELISGIDGEDDKEVVFIKDLIDANSETKADGTEEFYVYDFTNPCPPTCDPDSPLMN